MGLGASLRTTRGSEPLWPSKHENARGQKRCGKKKENCLKLCWPQRSRHQQPPSSRHHSRGCLRRQTICLASCMWVHFDCDALFDDASHVGVYSLLNLLVIHVLHVLFLFSLWHRGGCWAYTCVKLSCHTCLACFDFVLLMAPRWVLGIHLC